MLLMLFRNFGFVSFEEIMDTSRKWNKRVDPSVIGVCTDEDDDDDDDDDDVQ